MIYSWRQLAISKRRLALLSLLLVAAVVLYAGDWVQGPVTISADGDLVATTLESTGDALIGGTLRAEVPIESHTEGIGSPYEIPEIDAGTCYTNEGAIVETHFNLPSAQLGLVYSFCVVDDDGIQVNAAAGDTIRLGAMETISGGNVEGTMIGTEMRLKAINLTEWSGRYQGAWRLDGEDVFIVALRLLNNTGRTISWNAGDPEGVVVANPGSIVRDSFGDVYVKISGTAATGWDRFIRESEVGEQ